MNPWHELRALQHADGCFPSTVTSAAGVVADRNGFVTALVVRALRAVPTADWAELRRPALEFLWSCRSTAVPGAFAFWPDAARPRWAPAIPADADDTAIMLLELHRHGWIDRPAALQSACSVLLAHRVSAAEVTELPLWVEAGSFYTWLAPPSRHPTGRQANVADCCVNANVAALLSLLNARHLPGYAEAVRTVRAGVEWAGRDPARLSSLTPFYSSVGCLMEAAEHAVACGAEEMEGALRRLGSLPLKLIETGTDVCRSAYGKTVWHSAAVACARQVGRAYQTTGVC